MDPTEGYIRSAALQRGIDPDQAVRVAQSEGLNSYTGDGGSSFGPFQLHYGNVAPGGNAVSGLGDDFTKQTRPRRPRPKAFPPLSSRLYFAHRFGTGGTLQALRADPSAPAGGHLALYGW